MPHVHHDHVDYRGEALAEAARGAIIASGESWTDMRAAVFKELTQLNQPASAYDIAERMSTTLGRRVVPNSIYRILDLFVSANVAIRVESLNGFLANRHPDCVHDCIFLICDGCGVTRHVDDDSVSNKVRALSSLDGFRPQRPVIEVHGQCRACSGEGPENGKRRRAKAA
jgi:Fur family zinc uptake transcriptional regulator